MLKRFHNCIVGLNLFKLISLAVIFNLLISVLISLIAKYLDSSLNENFNGFGSLKEEFLAVVLVAPILETLFFQYCIIDYISKRSNFLISAIISALIFGLFHLYNIFYFFFAFCLGLNFAYFYIINLRKNRAILTTILFHLIHNLIIFIIKQT